MDSIVKRLRGVIHGIGLIKHISSVTPISEVDLKAVMKESGGLIYAAGYKKDISVQETGIFLIPNMAVHNPLGYTVVAQKQLSSYNFSFQLADTSIAYNVDNILFKVNVLSVDPNGTPYPYFTRRECVGVDNAGPSRGFTLALQFSASLDPADFGDLDKIYIEVYKLD